MCSRGAGGLGCCRACGPKISQLPNQSCVPVVLRVVMVVLNPRVRQAEQRSSGPWIPMPQSSGANGVLPEPFLSQSLFKEPRTLFLLNFSNAEHANVLANKNGSFQNFSASLFAIYLIRKRRMRFFSNWSLNHYQNHLVISLNLFLITRPITL